MSPSPTSPETTASQPTVGLMVKLTTREGTAENVIRFFSDAVSDATDEADTLTWMVVRVDATTFYIVDTFSHDAGRTAHIEGVIAQALRAQGPSFIARPPEIVPTEVVAFMPSAV